MMRPPIILLKEGTENKQGKQQIISNINACQVVADSIRTTLGPRGLDKLIVDSKGKTTISNDGATILKLLDIVFPAANVMVDIAKSQDAEVGDGTTSVVVLAAEILKRMKPFIEDGVHPQLIIRALSAASEEALSYLEELAIKIEGDKELRDMLVKCAMTTLSSKLVSQERRFFAEMVVDAVNTLDESLPLNMIGIKKVAGGNLNESRLVQGVAFQKAFSYAGFEMQPKHYENPLVALLNIELELKAEKDNAEMRLTTVEEFQAVVDAEWDILYNKLEKIHESGAKIVLSKLPIGDVATQWFADRDMFCAGRIPQEDLDRIMAACGGSILTTVSQIDASVLGKCEKFYEQQVGSERYNFFEGCARAQACTLLLRGGAEQFIAETERSLHDAIMIVRRAKKNDSIVAGGGAIEMELSRHLRAKAKTIAGKEQFFWSAYARSFEGIFTVIRQILRADLSEVELQEVSKVVFEVIPHLASVNAEECARFVIECMPNYISEIRPHTEEERNACYPLLKAAFKIKRESHENFLQTDEDVEDFLFGIVFEGMVKEKPENLDELLQDWLVYWLPTGSRTDFCLNIAAAAECVKCMILLMEARGLLVDAFEVLFKQLQESKKDKHRFVYWLDKGLTFCSSHSNFSHSRGWLLRIMRAVTGAAIEENAVDVEFRLRSLANGILENGSENSLELVECLYDYPSYKQGVLSDYSSLIYKILGTCSHETFLMKQLLLCINEESAEDMHFLAAELCRKVPDVIEGRCIICRQCVNKAAYIFSCGHTVHMECDNGERQCPCTVAKSILARNHQELNVSALEPLCRRRLRDTRDIFDKWDETILLTPH